MDLNKKSRYRELEPVAEPPPQQNVDEEAAREMIPLQPPQTQFVLRHDDEESSEKCCRICLDDDDPDSMIAPCHCRGGSKWVHRDCLDLWRTNEADRAFSQCTECQYYYQFESTHHTEFLRRSKFCLFVSRDICLMTVVLQALIGMCGYLTFLLDSQGSLMDLLGGGSNECSDDGPCHSTLAIYYLFGLLELLVCLGLFGSVVLCRNGCKIPDKDQTVPTMTTNSNRQHRATYYRQRRTRSSCCGGGPPRHSGDYIFPYSHPYYYYGGGGDDCCCCCCNGSGSNGSDCCCTGIGHIGGGSGSSSSGDGGGDGAHVLIVIVLVVLVILAVLGFFVGLFLGAVLLQRIVQRHMFHLQKKQLVHEFPVVDLSSSPGYDLGSSPGERSTGGGEKEATTKAPTDIYNAPPMVPPPSSKLGPEDALYLRKLGLLADHNADE